MNAAIAPHPGGLYHASIELDRSPESLRRDEPLTGRLRVRALVDESFLVTIELQAYVHGKVRQLFIFAEQRLHEGRLGANEERAFAFSVPGMHRVPDHKGTLFSIEPRLAAVLRIPSREPRPTALVGFLSHFGAPPAAELRARAFPSAMVALRASQAPAGLAVKLEDAGTLDATHEARSAKIASFVILFGLGTAAFAEFIRRGVPFGWSPWYALIPGFFALLLLGVGLWALVGGVWRVRAMRRVGSPAVTALARSTAGGDVLDVRVDVPTGVHDLRIGARLEVAEIVRIHAGSTVDVHEHPIVRHGAQLSAGGPAGAYMGSIPLPPEGSVPLPFDAKDVKIVWRLVIAIELPGWRDFERALALDVSRRGVPRETSRVLAWPLE